MKVQSHSQQTHPDFQQSSLERSVLIEWTNQLYQYAETMINSKKKKGLESSNSSESIDNDNANANAKIEDDDDSLNQNNVKRQLQIPRIVKVQSPPLPPPPSTATATSTTITSEIVYQSCTLRHLYDTEKSTLQDICSNVTCQNHTNNNNDSCCWDNILLLMITMDDSVTTAKRNDTNDDDDDDDISEYLSQYISNVQFRGMNILIYDTNKCSTGNSSSTHHNDACTTSSQFLLSLPMGIHHCTIISNSIVHINTSQLYHCTLISNTYIDTHTTILHCTSITSTSTKNDNNDNDGIGITNITVGAESSGCGRTVQVQPESTMIDVCQQIMRVEVVEVDVVKQQEQSKQQQHHQYQCCNIIGSYCIIRDTPTIQDIYCSIHSSIIAATSIKNVLMLSNCTITNHCTVSNTILQWNCCITDYCCIEKVLCMEHTHIGPKSIITNTIFGTDVHVSNGEIHCCIIGPNTAAHHQSLLISTIWLYGRGNIGYGSNIGSNHTGRLPDQEHISGEGIFYGLSCIIKYPINLFYAPYSIIAANTTLLSQYCTMPFSLFINNNNATSTSASSTDIIPGWVIQYSPYTIIRNESKYFQRRKTIRHEYYTGYKIIRPSIIDVCSIARQQLVSIKDSATTINDDYYYTNHDIQHGIGQTNQLSEKGRQIGIKAYTNIIQLYALQGLYTFLFTDHDDNENNDSACTNRTHWTPIEQKIHTEFSSLFMDSSNERNDDDNNDNVRTAMIDPTIWPTYLPWDDYNIHPEHIWKSQRMYLLQEFPIIVQDDTLDSIQKQKTLLQSWIQGVLEKYIQIETDFVGRIIQCKEKDDLRGMTIIPNYNTTNVMVNDDPVILSYQKEIKNRTNRIHEFIQHLSTTTGIHDLK